MSTLDKLSLRSGDFFVSVDITDENFLSKISKIVNGAVCVSNNLTKVKGVKHVSSMRELDESIFTKTLAIWKSDINYLNNLYRITDHLGLILLSNVPKKMSLNLESALHLSGLKEFWVLENGSNSSVDVLFRLRKYEQNGRPLYRSSGN